ncbi:hypothetical protein [Shouchella patagoniensis]|uniref:hypothetical protein n=1 Tax=Shouchella patagoniensis TaxID=228576 RepID=UPI001473F0EB|nr:hypothetical protein [Shouchella patagoniensis]
MEEGDLIRIAEIQREERNLSSGCGEWRVHRGDSSEESGEARRKFAVDFFVLSR